MALVVLSIDESKLPAHTQKEFEEWVKYCVGHFGGIAADNPLASEDLTATVKEVSAR